MVVVEAPRFGKPGPPMRRSPLIIGLTAGLGLLLAYSAYLAVQNVRSILMLIFIAMFLAIGLNPAVVRLTKWGVPRGLAVAAVGIGSMLLLCGGIFALIPPLVQQTGELVENLPGYIDNLRRNDQLNKLNEDYQLLDQLKHVATAGNVTKALGGVWGGVQVAFSALFNILTVVVLTLYFMAAFNRLKEGGYRLVPASRRERVRLLGDEILTKVGAYLGGALAIAVVAGLSSFVFLLIVGVAYPYALAVLVAITDLIPQIGATIGAVVVSVVGFATSIKVGIACVIFFIIYQQVENYLIYPNVMRRAVKVTDLAAILSVLLGVALLGVVGALIAIPVVAAVQLIVREVVIPRQDSR
ncbi:AI-2E family transporter [Dactylosporangium fulvum]|uniref:AI-2E family transporter n=1 Tax=Dactylosporangium fulvum TaxID=53359 RepID=A0ABY5WDD9_9ACTN|nr:AI-2E family transporter [Dactylosporangium fulvum]UWP87525.1 AI-2E family transporter [Dactylosporangium fulvum]